MLQWRIIEYVKFIETPIFTKEVQVLLEDDEYKSLQVALLLRPEQGSIILDQVGFEKSVGLAKA